MAAQPTVRARMDGLSTAVPPHILTQEAVEGLARDLFAGRAGLFERLRPAYANSGIDTRHSCVPLDWYRDPHGWKDRAELFEHHALDLLDEVARCTLERAGVGENDVDALVVVSSTGIATPSLDALLVERMGLRRDVQRLPVFGLGCAGGVLGLARAAALAAAMPGSKVLFLVVELCGLTFRRGDLTKSNIIATVLFGDGAAGALLSTEGTGPKIAGWGEYTFPESRDVMGWRIEEDGFGVLFSRDVPELVRGAIAPAARDALAAQGLGLADVDRFVCHPGGAKVIAALEDALPVAPGAFDDARAVLRRYGNMSAPTVLFVLDEALNRARPRSGRHLMLAMGPGFSAGFLTMLVGED